MFPLSSAAAPPVLKTNVSEGDIRLLYLSLTATVTSLENILAHADAMRSAASTLDNLPPEQRHAAVDVAERATKIHAITHAALSRVRADIGKLESQGW